MNSNYHEVSRRAYGRCEYCRAPEVAFNFTFHVDHIIPRSRGGSSDASNLALACESCNLFKSDVTDVTTSRDEEVRLYNPRIDYWDEHFIVNNESFEILGLTPIGRVTVGQLKLNSAFQIRARRHWVKAGLFP